MKTLAQHFVVAPEHRDLSWIKSAVQTAISLEQSTLPLYIAATYSLVEQVGPVYDLIRPITMGEMRHMAAVCNILAAIGETPQIKSLNPAFPSHGLPGGAEPDLFVCLAALSGPQLENFMRLEAPASLIDPRYADEKYESISNFYAAIRVAIVDNAEDVRAAIKRGGKSNQVGDNIGYRTITWSDDADCVESVLTAIDSIMAQGEGSVESAFYADRASDFEQSHFARFAQIYYKAAISKMDDAQPTRETLEKFFKGHSIQDPKICNTLAVPADGYDALLARDPARANVSKDLNGFDALYSEILAGLDDSWNGDPAKWWPTLGEMVTLMGKLRVLACFYVMKHEVPRDLVPQLGTIYAGDEFAMMSKYTRLNEPVFYGPRFRNLNVTV